VEATLAGRNVRRALMVCLQVVAAGLSPIVHWSPFIAITVGNLVAEFSELRIERETRPEYRLFAGWILMLANVALLVVIYSRSSPALLPAFTAMIMPLIGRYPPPVLVFGSALVIATELAVGLGYLRPLTPAVVMTTIVSAAVTIVVTAGTYTLLRSDESYRRESVIDPLTGLLNRRSLGSRTAELLEKAAFLSIPVAVLVFDLDHFKAINDELGHDVGDEVLARVSVAIQEHLRSSDAIFRIGGEEFLAVLIGVTTPMAMDLAENVRVAVQKSGTKPTVTTSAGVVVEAAGVEHDFDDLFRRADAALAVAKESGRNCVRAAVGNEADPSRARSVPHLRLSRPA